MTTNRKPRRLRAAILVAATIVLGGAALTATPNASESSPLDMGEFEKCLKNAPNNPDPVEAEEDIAWCCYKAGGDDPDNDGNGDRECVTPPAEGTPGSSGGPIVRPSEVMEPVTPVSSRADRSSGRPSRPDGRGRSCSAREYDAD